MTVAPANYLVNLGAAAGASLAGLQAQLLQADGVTPIGGAVALNASNQALVGPVSPNTNYYLHLTKPGDPGGPGVNLLWSVNAAGVPAFSAIVIGPPVPQAPPSPTATLTLSVSVSQTNPATPLANATVAILDKAGNTVWQKATGASGALSPTFTVPSGANPLEGWELHVYAYGFYAVGVALDHVSAVGGNSVTITLAPSLLADDSPPFNGIGTYSAADLFVGDLGHNGLAGMNVAVRTADGGYALVYSTDSGSPATPGYAIVFNLTDGTNYNLLVFDPKRPGRGVRLLWKSGTATATPSITRIFLGQISLVEAGPGQIALTFNIALGDPATPLAGATVSITDGQGNLRGTAKTSAAGVATFAPTAASLTGWAVTVQAAGSRTVELPLQFVGVLGNQMTITMSPNLVFGD